MGVEVVTVSTVAVDELAINKESVSIRSLLCEPVKASTVVEHVL